MPLLLWLVRVHIVTQNNGRLQQLHLFAGRLQCFPILAFVLCMVVSLFYFSLPLVHLNFLAVSAHLTSCQLFHSYIPILPVSFFSPFFQIFQHSPLEIFNLNYLYNELEYATQM